MNNNMNNNNQGRQYVGHEKAYDMFLDGQIRTSTPGAEERYAKYNSPVTSNLQQNYSVPVQNNIPTAGVSYIPQQQNYGANQASYGQPNSALSQNAYGNGQPSYDTLLQAYNARMPQAYGQKIVAVKKDGRGDILAFKLQNGNILDYAQMMQAQFDGQVSGMVLQANRQGEPIFRSYPDAFSDNNLDNLPTF